VPTLATTGVGKLRSGSVLLGFTDTATAVPQKMVVETITEKQGGDPDPHLYDLILVPEGAEDSKYYVGSEGTFYLVASELPIMTRAPYATKVLLHILANTMPQFIEKSTQLATPRTLAAAAPAPHATSAPAPHATFVQFLDSFRYQISATAVAPPIPKMAPRALMAAAPPKPLPVLVAEYMRSLNEAGPELNSTIGSTFETLSGTLVDQVESAVELGWRLIPKEGGDRIAVSIAGLHLEEHHPLRTGAPLRIDVKLYTDSQLRETHSLTDLLGRTNTTFAKYFDNVIYLDTKRSDVKGANRLVLEIYAGPSPVPAFSTSTELPAAYPVPTVKYELPAISADNNSYGRIDLDVRVMSEADIQEERQQALNWNDTLKMRFSDELGESLSKELTKALQTAQ
jgi:hypothetical protein